MTGENVHDGTPLRSTLLHEFHTPDQIEHRWQTIRNTVKAGAPISQQLKGRYHLRMRVLVQTRQPSFNQTNINVSHHHEMTTHRTYNAKILSSLAS